MSISQQIANGVFLYRLDIDPSSLVAVAEAVSQDYPFEKVDRRPHLTMEFPEFFDARDKIEAIMFRKAIYDFTIPPITHYMAVNGIENMYPKKDFITVSKLLPGEGMETHVDNPSKKSNHFICMLYLNNDYLGGEIEFPESSVSYKPNAGDVLIYKANVPHQVAPVIAGARYSVGYGLTDGII